MTEVSWDDVKDELDTRIVEVAYVHGALVNRWVLLADVVEENGERTLWSVAPSSVTNWDTLGMLAAGYELARLHTVESFEDDTDP